MSPQHHARLLHQGEIEGHAFDGGVMQSLVDPSLGAQHLITYRLTIPSDTTAGHVHPGAEEAVYVLEGVGEIRVGVVTHAIRSGQAAFVPNLVKHRYVNTGDGPLILLGALADIGSSTVGGAAIEPVLLDEQRVTPRVMGERSFRVLVSPDVGCQTMTQFTGVIPPGRAPLHAHPHEEAVYIIAGSGRLWIEDEAVGALRAGSVVFFPIGVRHTLENTGREDMKVLGAFSPAGSPEAKLPSAER
jgi:quercetin dioxygenase-like cupin family protein